MNKLRLYKFILHDNQFGFVVGFDENKCRKRVSQILNLHISKILEFLEVNPGSLGIILGSDVVDHILENGCRGYLNFIQGNNNKIIDENLTPEKIKQVKEKLKNVKSK